MIFPLAHPKPAKPTWPSAVARPDTRCCPPRPRNGWTGTPTHTVKAGCNCRSTLPRSLPPSNHSYRLRDRDLGQVAQALAPKIRRDGIPKRNTTQGLVFSGYQRPTLGIWLFFRHEWPLVFRQRANPGCVAG
jgi:hypothetical protein